MRGIVGRSLRFGGRTVLVLLMAGSLGEGCRAAAQPPLLQAGEAVHERLAGSEDRYTLELDQGFFVRISLIAEAPIRVRLSDPEDRGIIDEPVAPGVEVFVSTISGGAGRFGLSLSTATRDISGIGYRIKVAEARPARGDDAGRTATDLLVLQATSPESRARPEAARAAIESYEKAFGACRDRGDQEEAVRILIRSSRLHFRIGRSGRAAELLETALRLSRKTDNPALEAKALNAASRSYVLQGKGPEALVASRRVLQRARDTDDRWLEAQALLRLGDALYSVAQMSEALDSYLQAETLCRELGWRRGQAEALLNLGHTYIDRGEEEKALAALTGSRSLWEALGDASNGADTLRALGGLHFKLDDKQAALDYYHQAQALLPPAVEGWPRANLFGAMGWIYFDLGGLGVAANYFRQALETSRAAGYLLGEGVNLHQLGLVASERNDYARARKYYQDSLSLFREMGDLRWTALLSLELGAVRLREGHSKHALEMLTGALASVREHAGPYMEARCLEEIGLAHHELGDYDAAFQAYEGALALLRAGRYRYREAQTRLQLARLERDRGRLEEAREQFENAIAVIESVRLDIPGPELRASYFSSTHHYFEFYTDLLMRLDAEKPDQSYDAAAFQVSEQGRARSLLDRLAEARVQIREGVDADLLKREADLKRRLNNAAARQMGLTGADQEQIKAIADEIQRVTTDYEQVRALIRSRSPRYAALTQPDSLTLGEVQRQLLDGDTVLLEYALGEQRSYLWAVTTTSYQSRKLPGREEIEKRVLELRELLTARDPRPGESTRTRRLRIREAKNRYWKEAAALSEILLGPVAATIRKKRLLIVSDGVLRYLPFAALPVPGGSSDETIPLVVEHELVRLPSASTLSVLRKETSGRQPAEKWLAVLADPVFEADDPRLPSRPAGDNTEAAVESPPGGISFPRLPSTRVEAEAISRLVPAGEATSALGFAANRQLAISPELGHYRIVHFATHSILHHEHAELSGVALSMFSERGDPVQGFLRLHDIYNFRLPVEVIVLSACESFLGKEVRGEGLLGIVRGFMYAGARRVIASLWKVDDLATKELMVRFYSNVFRKGESPAAALRNAQIDMWRQPDWRSPYFWAPFVLQGEWR